MVITRDFSNFPFRQLDLTIEEINGRFFHHFKFETPEYIAYVPESFQDYIKPEHLYQKDESVNMKRARKLMWGDVRGPESYDILKNCGYECREVLEEWDELFDKEMQDTRHLHPELSDAYEEIRKKYTMTNFIINSLDLTTSQVGKIALITAVAVSAIAGLVFFYPVSFRH